MPDYTPPTTLTQLITQYAGGSGPPQGTDAASDLHQAVRQLQGFLINFLSVSLDPDTGLIKSGVLSESTFTGSTDVIPASAIQGNIDGGKITAGTVSQAQLAIVDSDGDNGAVATVNVNNLAITSDKLAASAVIAGKIATGGVSASTQFAAGVVDAAALGTNAVTNDKVATGISGSKLSDDTVAPKAISNADLAGGETGLLWIDGTAVTSNKAAKIGGSLTATYNAATNTIEFAIAAASSANVAKFELTASGSSATTLTARTGWSKVAGPNYIAIDGTDPSKINITSTGTYLAFFSLVGYSCEAFQAQLVLTGVTGSPHYGNTVFIPLGTQSESSGQAVFTFTSATDYVQLYHIASRVQATNGLGYTAGSVPAKYGQLTIIKLA